MTKKKMDIVALKQQLEEMFGDDVVVVESLEELEALTSEPLEYPEDALSINCFSDKTNRSIH